MQQFNSFIGNVLIAAPVHPVLTDGLSALGYNCIHEECITQQTAYGLIGDCVGVVTSTRLQLDRELLDAAPLLKWIGRMGSGMEVIDLDYAAGKGIECFGSPEGNCNAVGEHALGMLLSLNHRIARGHDEMINGIWRREENRGFELEGKVIGIIGFGHTGAAFAHKLQGFDVKIMAFDKYRPEAIPSHIVKCNSIEDMYQEADVISFHVPALGETRHYFNDSFLDSMKKPFILINTSRGTVVDTRVLARGLSSGKITGACLDVFEQEPVTAFDIHSTDHAAFFSHMPNVVVTPHIAGYTHEALYKMSKVLLDKISAHKMP